MRRTGVAMMMYIWAAEIFLFLSSSPLPVQDAGQEGGLYLLTVSLAQAIIFNDFT